MDDIISQGGDRPPGGRRRGLVIAAAIIAVAALVAVEHFPHRGPARAHRAAGRWHGAVTPVVTPRPQAPRGPSGITGPTAPVPVGTRIPRTGPRPAWFWPATGTVEPIAGLPYHRLGYLFTRVGGGWAIQPDPVGPAGCADCPGLPVPVYYLGDHDQAATLVSLATMAAPAATSDAMWLTSFRATASLGTAAGVSREYSGSGARLSAAIRLPPGYTVAQGTRGGLLLAPVTQDAPAQADRLWSPATHSVLAAFSHVLAVSPGAIAYTGNCPASCRVRVLSLATSRTISFRPELGNAVANGAFSPDGRYLALQISSGNSAGSDTLAMRLEVAVTATGRVTLVPHAFVSSDALDGFGWPADGDYLAAELTFSTRVQLAFWGPGEPDLAVADIQPGDHLDRLVVG